MNIFKGLPSRTLLSGLLLAGPVGTALAAELSVPEMGSRGLLQLEEQTPFDESIKASLISKDSRSRVKTRLLVTETAVKKRGWFGRMPSVVELPDKLESQSVFVGREAAVVGVHFEGAYRPEAESYTKGQYVVLNENGAVTLKIDSLEGGRIMRPSPSGSWAVGWFGQSAPTLPPVFFHKGKKFTAKDWPREFHATEAAFSPDGRRVALTAVNPNPSRTFIYDSEGQSLGSIGRAGKALFVRDGTKILLASDGKLFLYGLNGAVVSSADLHGANWLSKFAHVNSNRVAVFTSANRVALVEIDGLRILWQKDLSALMEGSISSGTDFQPLGIDCSDAASKIVLAFSTLKWEQESGGGRHVNKLQDYVLVVGPGGAVVDHVSFPAESIQRIRRSDSLVVISRDGSHMSIPLKDRIASYALVD